MINSNYKLPTIKWHHWSDEVFNIAKQNNKPIFLYLGFEQCYSCLAIENERFSDKETIEIINNNFIAIKLYYSDNPDIYIKYLQYANDILKTKGFSLIFLLTPAKEIFFMQRLLNKNSLISVLTKTAIMWHQDKDSLVNNNALMIYELTKSINKEKNKDGLIHLAYHKIQESLILNNSLDFIDFENLTISHLMFLIHYYKLFDDQQALKMGVNFLNSVYEFNLSNGYLPLETKYLYTKKTIIKVSDYALVANAFALYHSETKNPIYKDFAYQIIYFIEQHFINNIGLYYESIEFSVDSNSKELFKLKKLQLVSLKTLLIDNSIMASTYAFLGRIFLDNSLILKGELLSEKIIQSFAYEDTILISSLGSKELSSNGNFSDYVYFVYSQIKLFCTTSKEEYLVRSIFFTTEIFNLFPHEVNKNIYQSYLNQDSLELTKYYDNHYPSPYSLLTNVLIKLNEIDYDPRYLKTIRYNLENISALIVESPCCFPYFLMSYLRYKAQHTYIIIIGNKESNEVKNIKQAIHSNFNPFITAIFLDPERLDNSKYFSDYLSDFNLAAFICNDGFCDDPLTEYDEIFEVILEITKN